MYRAIRFNIITIIQITKTFSHKFPLTNSYLCFNLCCIKTVSYFHLLLGSQTGFSSQPTMCSKKYGKIPHLFIVMVLIQFHIFCNLFLIITQVLPRLNK